MKLYVVCDLEGVAGVVDHRQQCQWDADRDWYGKYLDQARRLATLELNAFVEGALAGGATEIIAWEGHGSFPGCIDVELLHPECKLLMGAAERGPAGLDRSFDAMAQIGLHAMEGTATAVLPHGKWRLNGILLGEIGMNCLQAGYFGFPCIFLSGDKAAVTEATALIPELETVCVKERVAHDETRWSPAPALSLSPEKARTLIREGAQRAVARLKTIKPYMIDPPYELDWFFDKPEYVDEIVSQGKAERIDTLTVRTRGDDLIELLS